MESRCGAKTGEGARKAGGEFVKGVEEVLREKLVGTEGGGGVNNMSGILDDRLLNPGEKLSNAERIIKEEEDWLDFDAEMIVVDNVDVKNLAFASLQTGEGKALLLIRLRFYGVEQAFEFEVTLEEIATKDFGYVVDTYMAERLGGGGVFGVVECVQDGDCYNMEGGGGYCKELCEVGGERWMGVCPNEYGECFLDDEECFNCFGKCELLKCVYS